MAKRRWMLTGACGNLAWSLRRLWAERFPADELVLVSRDTITLPDGRMIAWPLGDLARIGELIDLIRPDIVLHCAAMSDPAACEADPLAAQRINREITARLARQVRRCSGWMLYCSTDFVFAGDQPGQLREDDIAAPRTAYGASKLAGEQALLEQDGGLVARLSLMFDPMKPASANTWAKIRTRLLADADLFGVTDEWRTPIAFDDAAQILLTLAMQERRGVVHVGGPETMSPYDLIMRLRQHLGSRSAVRQMLGSEANPGIARPRNAALDTARLRQWLAAGDETGAATKREPDALSL